MLEATVDDGPKKLRLQEEVFEACGVNANISLFRNGLGAFCLCSFLWLILLVVNKLIFLRGVSCTIHGIRHAELLQGAWEVSVECAGLRHQASSPPNPGGTIAGVDSSGGFLFITVSLQRVFDAQNRHHHGMRMRV